MDKTLLALGVVVLPLLVACGSGDTANSTTAADDAAAAATPAASTTTNEPASPVPPARTAGRLALPQPTGERQVGVRLSEFQIEMTRKVRQAGGVIEEIPIAFVDRVRGTSKMSTAIVVEALLLVTRWGIADRLGR